jgi:hypothetical protein
MPRTKANLKSRKANIRASKGRTRKNIEHAKFISKKERILQAAIAGRVIQEEVVALQDDGIIPALPAGAGVLAAPPVAVLNPLDQVLDIEQAALVLHAAAERAADPAPLHEEITRRLEATRRSGCVVRFAVRHLISIFMTIIIAYYASFPFHAAPREISLFDTAASHLSMAASGVGFLDAPLAGILTNCAYGAKVVGKMVRNYNARSGRFVNAPGNAERRILNVAEYDPSIGTPLSLARIGGIGVTAAFDALTGKPVSLFSVGSAVFMSGYADMSVNLGKRFGLTEENSLKRASKFYGST